MVDSTYSRSAFITRLKLGFAAALAFTIIGNSPALSQSPETASTSEASEQTGPAIWKLSDEDTIIYLFGFAQALKPNTEWRNAAFDQAFESADIVILESLTPDAKKQAEMQKAIQANGLYKDGRKLSSVLQPDDLELVSSVAQGLGVPIQGLDPLKPWLASIQLGVIAVNRQGLDVGNTPSVLIQKQAAKAGKSVHAFEEPTDLLFKIAALPEAEHIGMLTHEAKRLSGQPDDSTLLNTAWLNGNVSEIGNLLHGPNGYWSSDVVYQTMLLDRNAAWSEAIDKVMRQRKGTIMVAVGLGHLAGKDSLVTILEQKGYTVERQ